jgi:hypothetical protein
VRCVSTGRPSRSESTSRAERLIAAGKKIYLAGFMGAGKSATAGDGPGARPRGSTSTGDRAGK